MFQGFVNAKLRKMNIEAKTPKELLQKAAKATDARVCVEAMSLVMTVVSIFCQEQKMEMESIAEAKEGIKETDEWKACMAQYKELTARH